HFFGNLHTEQIATVKQSMGIITRQCSSLTFGLDNVGVFPSLQRPRIIWIGLKGDIDQLHSLKKKINLFLKEHGFPLDDKKFSPHITIGRVKALNRDYILANELKSAAIHSERAITLKELILYKSVLTPHGPHYTILEAFPFSIPP
ncbi:MAG: RNA 2',3'-cyclic phosphodiesterase, partial [Candidatus Omnitrophica bacterium]|nr:RNA 2',3'-cyclic phosphodiesterase [Candidatus Omnitrophota bacterium]